MGGTREGVISALGYFINTTNMSKISISLAP